ncbi:hypothetical protein [Sulfurospirillum arcachonense]|uniref:hypothetical protein n=1 Tax=Sulfurospirillum arcachonense TaxID=57666 RepID=UPI00046AC813|nr:hypothetical protein [Sulfurospirillum arcachonense]
MKIIHIFLIILVGIIFSACSEKQSIIAKKTLKPAIVEKKVDNYKKALSYENKDGSIKSENYKKYLDKAIKEKNPKAYVKAFENYKNPIGKKTITHGKPQILIKPNIQKATHFALLAIENKKSKEIACETIKKAGNQNMFDANQSYEIYLANKAQGCTNINDKDFDFKFTPAAIFINKTKNNSLYKEQRTKILNELINEYSKQAINGTLDTKYTKYDDRWVLLSTMATNLAMIKYENGDKESAGSYLGIAKKIIEATPLNKNRYYKFDTKTKSHKKFYHAQQRDKIIKAGSDQILKTLLKII